MGIKNLSKTVYVQYIVSYKKELVLFYSRRNRQLLAQVDIYDMDGDAAAEAASQKLDSSMYRLFKYAHVVINSYDRSTFVLKLRKMGLNNSKIIGNYLRDNLGDGYSRRFVIRKNKLNSGKSGSYTMFRIIPKARLERIKEVLYKMGIKNTYIVEEDHSLSKLASKVCLKRNGFVILDKPGSSVVNVVLNHNITKSFVIDSKPARISKFNTQFSSLKNLVTALYLESQYDCEDLPLTAISFYGRKETLEKLKENLNVGLKFNYYGENTPFLLNFNKPFGAKYQTYKATSTVNRRRLGGPIHKGFTLVETVVSFAVFGIISAALMLFMSASYQAESSVVFRTLASNYVSNVSEIFRANPSGSVDALTASVGSGNNYYLDEEMDYTKPSSTSDDMKFAVKYTYNTETINYSIGSSSEQTQTKYTFTILNLSLSDGSREIISDAKSIVVIK